jgi:hypothetical protein
MKSPSGARTRPVALVDRVDACVQFPDQATAAPQVLTPPCSSIDLGPDLPLAVFTSTERWHPERIGALAIYCSDGRWGEAFDEFCHKHLQIPRYDRLALAGGPAWLAAPEGGSELSRAVRDHLDFLVRVHELGQIVLITHYGCAHYGHLLGQPPRECLPAQYADVRAAAAQLRARYPEIVVDGYLAMRTENCLSFHRLAT